MRTTKYLSFLIVLSIFIVGCSKEAKDEAAQLEKELSGEAQMAADSAAVADSLATALAAKAAEEEAAEMEALAQQQAAELAKMPKKPDGDGYTVQVAGCEDRDYATHLVEVFSKRGYEPYITSITVENQGYYRVRIGIFANLADAKALQAELNDKYSLETWVDVTVNSF